jgi:zinc finger SWIM domain-containing protein 3
MAVILRAGDLFSSFDEVEKVMKEYERASYVNFYISDSRSIGAASSKAPRITEKARKELKYHRLVYACIHGGRKFVSKSKGRRKMRFI